MISNKKIYPESMSKTSLKTVKHLSQTKYILDSEIKQVNLKLSQRILMNKNLSKIFHIENWKVLSKGFKLMNIKHFKTRSLEYLLILYNRLKPEIF
jgi:hypothetical protein